MGSGEDIDPAITLSAELPDAAAVRTESNPSGAVEMYVVLKLLPPVLTSVIWLPCSVKVRESKRTFGVVQTPALQELGIIYPRITRIPQYGWVIVTSNSNRVELVAAPFPYFVILSVPKFALAEPPVVLICTADCAM